MSAIYHKKIKEKHIEPIISVNEAKQILQDNLQNIQSDTALSVRVAIEILLDYVNVLENEARANRENLIKLKGE